MTGHGSARTHGPYLGLRLSIRLIFMTLCLVFACLYWQATIGSYLLRLFSCSTGTNIVKGLLLYQIHFKYFEKVRKRRSAAAKASRTYPVIMAISPRSPGVRFYIRLFVKASTSRESIRMNAPEVLPN